MLPRLMSCVVGTQSGAVLVRDPATGERVHTLKGHGDAVTCLAVLPGGRFFTSGGGDGVVRVWE